ncbi:MAG TPA: PspC domain-containing protein [Bryobacteraceae bacterium]|nr:PspC domain-containing protein [Bryobacteraceae bacterium]
MFCTNCGVTLREQDRYCSQCGRPTGARQRTLALDKSNKKIAGVCAGLARYLDSDVTLIRIVVLVLALSTGIGFILYLVAWMLMPNEAALQPRGASQVVEQT